MRRALPWLLVGLVAAGAGLGMGIGIADQSPVSAQAQISQIISTTEGAGTARFTITTRTISSNPELRSASVESGEIDFTSDDMVFDNPLADNRTSSANTDTRIIVTRRTLVLYEDVGQPGSGGTVWLKDTMSAHSRERTEIFNAYGPFGELQFPNAIKILQFEDLGLQIVRGEGTTKYHFGTSTCESTSNGVTQHVSSALTTLWVDSQGRLIQGAATQTVVIHSPHIAGAVNGRLISTVTVRLYDFGAPVTVTAPRSIGGAMSIIFDGGKCTG